MESKNFLFVSTLGYAIDLAWHVFAENNKVKFYIEDDESKDIADGFFPKTDDWQREVDWADVIIFDDVLGQGKKAQQLRKQGKLVVGGTPYTDRLEDDRAFGQEELKKVGVPIIPHYDFSDFDEAIKFVRENPGRYILKPNGEVANMKSFVFLGEEEDGRDVIQILGDYKKAWSKKIKSFQLQKRIVGVEVAVGAFFNGKEFIYPINVNFEHKKLFPGDLGPYTGEMGTSMFWSAPNRIFNLTLKKMETRLQEENYVGYIDINCMVNVFGIYPLEFTSRFGYPTISIQQEGILSPIGEVLYQLAKGEPVKLRTRTGFQVGVEIVVPPFPFQDKKTFEVNSKDAVIVFKKPNRDGVHIEEVKQIDGEWIVTGTEGTVLTIVGTGSTMKQAQSQAYQRIKNILIPNMYYRTDIGDRWSEDSDRLHNWGYLREM
ncbi:MAG: phosphoribosylamine--glycine ligase [Candidatus Buchananbacteria bacterium RIFCSPHIGHO2_02_FULL_45_11b]|uniref:phosphoribosylamine--glycine ligase n=4 Tax=Candidatus Buchananiibacteriota TaxID=1817903 RepID=A0A1G1YID9_9BACT|nr:MAG: phosphoribosylamine--glycine ligase [Candidatus Buchananbacteria bacterium RIFCSPHIGHO2_01_FULL_46_12]OGY52105.1 MAG: phosphoribosylamine--glycine ligase [Candidatus Buchananbacteria bacterium RIFCSPHIGHO2_02_FULL_45_11b]OGY53936.1 MAG: phosphoribosylamine--glycine ligase [Candidatus Buchananbacteria bacterium RIFCSPLOWO2_01_FULL_45_31]OGY57975.1 MAG: phosphoribosylamine--glycine ligase [Candidatus Buchananbacteria bacterium RIFCSPLOWO2_02_FULL_46_11b]